MPGRANIAEAPRILTLPNRLLWAGLGMIGYLGGLAILGVSALRSIKGEPSQSRPKLWSGLLRQLDQIFGVGIPLVGLIHVGFGSFLSMQAYYGATFTEANGAVVGLGLIRNVAPLLTGLTLAALMSVRAVADLSRGATDEGWDAEEIDPDVPDRGTAPEPAESTQLPVDPSRLTLIRLLAVAIAGPVLSVWGTLVGTVIGAVISSAVLGLPTGIYFGLIRQMIGTADVMGLIINGIAFPTSATLIACYEGLRAAAIPESERLGSPPAYRAIILGITAILFLNFCWFNLVYLSGGTPFGPPLVDLGS